MKTILLPFHDEEAGRMALNAATLVAERFNAYLEGLLVRGSPRITFPQGMAVSSEYLSDAARDWRTFANSARGHFKAIAEAKGLPFHELESGDGGPAFAWRELEGRESEIVGAHGRVFDLIVIGRTTSMASWQEVCEAAIFETGRPVLLASSGMPETLGDVIVIAWNGSTETARTVGLGMPFLQAAQKVIVLSIEEGMQPGPNGAELVRHLVRNGVKATAQTARADGRGIGTAIMDEAAALGADMIFKGAFTSSRLRQMIFGGATQFILDHATLPVLLGH